MSRAVCYNFFVLFVLTCAVQILHGKTVLNQKVPPVPSSQVRDSAGRGHIKHNAHSHPLSAPVPVMSVSLTDTHHRHLLRLMLSIDYPVSLLLVTAGNANATTLMRIREDFNEGKAFLISKFPHLKTTFNESAHNPGSVAGFNAGMRSLLGAGLGLALSPASSSEVSADARHLGKAKQPAVHANAPPKWALVVNSDIAFYPGVLKTIAVGTNRLLALNGVATGPPFGLGFTSLCCGSEWSAVVFTEDLVRAVGLFDENFYPAYYEDVDYGIRVSLSGFRAQKIPDTPLLHGALNGSTDYLSSVFDQLYFSPRAGDADLAQRRAVQYRGARFGREYIQKKWGISVGSFRRDGSFQPPSRQELRGRPETDCKSAESINRLGKRACKPGYTLPFGRNDTGASIRRWELDEGARQTIIRGDGID